MIGGLNPLLAYAAGALTILSPCVLPLAPIVLGSAAQRHRFGPVALAAGLVISFTGVGLAVAILGASAGFDGEIVRKFGAAVLSAIGAALLLPKVEALAGRLVAPLASWASQRLAGAERFGLAGQAGIGVLLGLVWSPCVGPMLGAATLLAAQGRNLGQVTLVMAAFGAGIASVLLVLAFATRGLLSRWRGQLKSAGAGGKRLFGAILLAVGLLILTGGDRVLEALIVAASPHWLTDLTTAI